MVKSMASVKVTITVPEKQLAAIRKKVAAGEAASVSGFVQDLIKQSVEGSMSFRELLDQMLMETGGPTTAKERAWARAMLNPKKRSVKGSRAA